MTAKFEIYRKRPMPGGFIVDEKPCASFDYWTLEFHRNGFMLKKILGEPLFIKADHMNYEYRTRYAGHASEVRTESYYD